jgi:integrase/recombinase XerD
MSFELSLYKDTSPVYKIFEDKWEKFFYGLFENQKSEHTKKAYKRDVIQFLIFMKTQFNLVDLVKIEREHIIAFRNFVETHGGIDGRAAANQTVNRKLSAVSVLFTELINRQAIKINPCAGVKRLRKPKLIETNGLMSHEIEGLLDSTNEDSLLELMEKAVLYTYFTTGFRLDALASLKIKDFVNAEEGRAFRYSTKGDKKNIKLLNITSSELIEKYLKKCTESRYPNTSTYREQRLVGVLMYDMAPENIIFRPTRASKNDKNLNKKLSPNNLLRIMRKYANRAGIKSKISIHSARVSYAFVLKEAGVPIEDIADEMDHSSIVQTKAYIDRLNKLKRKEAREFSFIKN